MELQQYRDIRNATHCNSLSLNTWPENASNNKPSLLRDFTTLRYSQTTVPHVDCSLAITQSVIIISKLYDDKF